VDDRIPDVPYRELVLYRLADDGARHLGVTARLADARPRRPGRRVQPAKHERPYQQVSQPGRQKAYGDLDDREPAARDRSLSHERDLLETSPNF
jgi:hypothetical protein